MAIPVSGVAEAAEVPMISPMPSAAATTENKRFVFRLAFLDSLQGEVVGRSAADEMNDQRRSVVINRLTEGRVELYFRIDPPMSVQ